MDDESLWRIVTTVHDARVAVAGYREFGLATRLEDAEDTLWDELTKT
jgi:hypothetical protein